MAASDWVASVSISASSARTESASISSSRKRAARCIRAARDCRRLCSRRERRFSLGRSVIGQILKGFGDFHNRQGGTSQKRNWGEKVEKYALAGPFPFPPVTQFPFPVSGRGRA